MGWCAAARSEQQRQINTGTHCCVVVVVHWRRCNAGVQHVLLERAAALTDHPQAHFINNRSMEVRVCR